MSGRVREEGVEERLTPAGQKSLSRRDPEAGSLPGRSPLVLLKEGDAFDVEDAGNKFDLSGGDGPGMGGDGKLASPVEGGEKAPFGKNAGRRFGIRDPGKKAGDPVVPPSAFKAERSLSDGREGELGGKKLPDPVGEAQPDKAGCGKDDGVDLPLVEFFEPGTDISPEGLESEVRSLVSELGHAPKRGGADSGAGGQGGKGGESGGDQSIPRILPSEDGADDKAVGKKGRHILHAVDGEIDRSRDERLLDLLDEESLASDLGEGDGKDHVPRRLDDDEFGGASGGLPKELGHMAGLPQGELRSTGSDAYGRVSGGGQQGCSPGRGRSERGESRTNFSGASRVLSATVGLTMSGGRP